LAHRLADAHETSHHNARALLARRLRRQEERGPVQRPEIKQVCANAAADLKQTFEGGEVRQSDPKCTNDAAGVMNSTCVFVSPFGEGVDLHIVWQHDPTRGFRIAARVSMQNNVENDAAFERLNQASSASTSARAA
jgi:hypothetical protein